MWLTLAQYALPLTPALARLVLLLRSRRSLCDALDAVPRERDAALAVWEGRQAVKRRLPPPAPFPRRAPRRKDRRMLTAVEFASLALPNWEVCENGNPPSAFCCVRR